MYSRISNKCNFCKKKNVFKKNLWSLSIEYIDSNDRFFAKTSRLRCLVVCLWLNVPLKNISLIWKRHRLKKGLCLASMASRQGGIFIVPHLLWHGASVFAAISGGPPSPNYLVAFYDKHGVLGTYSAPDPPGIALDVAQ